MPERESVRANISAPISDRPIATSYEIICALERKAPRDRKSTRLNSSHLGISYAVFCLKKKKKKMNISQLGRSYVVFREKEIQRLPSSDDVVPSNDTLVGEGHESCVNCNTVNRTTALTP